ncbi:hypothetical protein WJX74_007138 [Apatococcus lobatus]|uniref:JmjC domain-containing protein n=1 Tax=Apatococcus lobatus TaxID=904363 RepID=A0AAW1QX35_9CHLO
MGTQPSIDLDLLECLLQRAPSEESAEATVERHKLRTAALVYDVWTEKGKDVSGLAGRLTDGSVNALEAFLQPASPPQTVHSAFQGHIADDIAASTKVAPDSAGHEAMSGSVPYKPFVNGGSGNIHSVPRRDANHLSYSDFVREFMAPNLPVIIQGSPQGWRAMQDWVTSDGKPDIDFLEQHFGDATVNVTDTSRQAMGNSPCTEMKLHQYVAWWRLHQSTPGASTTLLYLKDWHFASTFRNAYQAYTTPVYFQDDWLNDYHDACQRGRASQGDPPGSSAQNGVLDSDYRFVYLGCKGTWTGLHADVLRSYSWSTNVAGRKLWRLLPSQHTHLLYDRFGREMAPSFEAAVGQGERFPSLQYARALVQECVQEAGESIFVPSGWHHTVENLEDTLSINHNWLNCFNLDWTWGLIRRDYFAAQDAIEDCRSTCEPEEFEALVQRNLAANSGLDFAALADLLLWAIHRAKSVTRRDLPGMRKQQLDVQRAQLVLADMLQIAEAAFSGSIASCLSQSLLEASEGSFAGAPEGRPSGKPAARLGKAPQGTPQDTAFRS